MIYVVSAEVVTIVGDSFGPSISISSTNILSYVMLVFFSSTQGTVVCSGR